MEFKLARLEDRPGPADNEKDAEFLSTSAGDKVDPLQNEEPDRQ
jgi:hypothetical protein